MSNSSDLDVRKRAISATLDDVRATEQYFRDQGVDIADEDEWLQLRDIVARIERRMLADMPMSINSTTSEVEKIDMPTPSTPTHEAAE